MAIRLSDAVVPVATTLASTDKLLLVTPANKTITLTNFFAGIVDPVVITEASATALAVGRQGTTAPAFVVDSSAANSATGVKITAAAAASGVSIAAISSGTNESLKIDAKGSGHIAFQTTATGNVGIGIALPTVALQVARVSATNDTPAVYFNVYAGADVTLGPLGFNVGINPSATAGSRYGYLGFGDNGAMRPMALNTNAAGAFGNVGVGTVSPSARLQVNVPDSDASSYANDFAVVGSSSKAVAIGANATYVWMQAHGSVSLCLNPIGNNVGIGTLAPVAVCEVYGGSDTSQILWGHMVRNGGNGNTTGYGSGIKLKNAGDGDSTESNKWAGIAAVAGTAYADSVDLVFYSTGLSSSPPSELMRLKGAGNFGIGTTAPDRKVEINATDGNCLRMTYNDSNGSAANYCDLAVSSSGDLTITPSGGDVTVAGNLTLSAKNIITDTTTGMQIGTGATQKVAFYGAPPVVRQAHIADAAGDDAAIVNAIIDALEAYGLLATS